IPKSSKPSNVDWLKEKESENTDMSFEDKINKFMKQSNENLQQARTRENKRSNNRRKNNNS
ncbi:MAG: hypothetical protein QMB54_04525, partial [Neofamilia sp.]